MPETTLADLLKIEADQHRDVHSVQTLFMGGDLLLAFSLQGGELAFYYLVGNRMVPACLDQHLSTLPDALRADWGEAFTPDGQQCPKCAAPLLEEAESPVFFALRGGMTPSTPDGPGERWVEGVYTCLTCGHQWEAQRV